MGKCISTISLSPTLTLSEQTDGVWLWDDTRKMNLSMRAGTRMDALVQALSYYQNRLLSVEQDYTCLKERVDTFIEQFVKDSPDD